MNTQSNEQSVGNIENSIVDNINNNKQSAKFEERQGREKVWFSSCCHWWVWGTNILLFIINLVLLISVVPRNNELDFDYNGVIVGVLSLLVTALIGWNIYTLIDVKAIQQTNEKLKKDNEVVFSRINIVERSYNSGLEQVETTLATLFFYERRNSNNAFLAYQSIYHWLRAIAMASEKENFNSCAGYVASLLVCTKELPVLSKNNKDLLRHAYNQIPNKEKIQNINMVDTAINEIKTDDEKS